MHESVELHFALTPRHLPPAPRRGRVAVLDIAFAAGHAYWVSTVPYIRALGSRLALWIDHHEHPAWPSYGDDDRFVLVCKEVAPACPQLVTPQRVSQAGAIRHVVAHADFDGCMAAAKFLKGGHACYPGADEDARCADAPGRGFRCSPRGEWLWHALMEGRASLPSAPYEALLADLSRALAEESMAATLRQQVDTLVQAFTARTHRLETLVGSRQSPMPHVVLLDVGPRLGVVDKHILLRRLETLGRVAIVRQGEWLTAGTFEHGPCGLDLAALPGLTGQRGLAWGRSSFSRVATELARQLAHS